MTHAERIRAAIQAVLEDEGDGWHCAQFVICMGLERVDSEGRLDSSPWVWAPPDQPDWQTTGLLEEAVSVRADEEE